MRANSISDILSKKYDEIEWSQEWADAFGNPEPHGMWCIWGNSGNGKTSFAMQLAKELSDHGRVLYNSHEEGVRKTMRKTLEKNNMQAYSGKVLVGVFTYDETVEKLSKRGSPQFVMIDSIQAAKLTYKQIENLVKMFPKKLFVFISRAKNDQPYNKAGEDAKYDADLKIQVKGFRAISHGRENVGEYYTIWPQKAAEFWGNN